MAAPRHTFPHPPPPGVALVGDEAVFCVVAAHASAVELCLFDPAGAESRVTMKSCGRGRWAVRVPGIRPGQRYGFRADGPWEPRAGHRYNPAKLLLDPYTRAVDGGVQWVPEVFGHAVDATFAGDGDVRDTRDSAPFTPRSIVVAPSAFDWGDDTPPRHALRDSVVYELHVRGFTAQLAGVPPELRGTYAGLAHPASIAHLTSLGVTAVELLPVHAFIDEPHLVKLGLTNYWGYNTLGFFAPHAGYAVDRNPVGAVDEFKTMVKALHAANIEVILDVVYNHTAEQGGHEGATLSLRGLDNATAYRLDEGGRDVDVTGCGNSLDAREATNVQLVLDSLRYWVTEMHVDGFRFDLAVTLGRAPADEFEPDSPLLVALRTDPVLSQVKLIAEPWDVGMHGWRTGQFPVEIAEWNDRFRNTVRDFWLTDVARSQQHEPGHGVADLATRLAGSRDLFGTPLRRPEASINYVTAHDGFTLADLTAYDHKHNLANGENGHDGTDDNRSWNHGVEGPSDDPALLTRRRRTHRNVLGTLLLTPGVPMLTAGDEFARTQSGNNNAYCQDSEIGWVDWELDDARCALLATTRSLISWRRRFSVLRPVDFFPGTTHPGDGPADVRWFDVAGRPMSAERWADGRTRTLQAFFDGGSDHPDSVLLVLHGDAHDTDVALPQVAGVVGWNLLWDSTCEQPDDVVHESWRPGGSRPTTAASMHLFTAAR